ncbi:MAG: hypothetical protein HKN91_14835 [Acidimicrobiia bacterium]|nr:hypothetical protein [Acidimicrobiia bacterium]
MGFMDRLSEGFNDIGGSVGDWAIKIAIAIVILVIGRWIIGLVKKWVVRLLETDAAGTVFEKSGIKAALAPSGRSAPAIVGTVLGAFLMVLLWLIIANVLEVQPVVDLLERLLAVLPLILIAVVLVIIAAAVGSFVADLVTPHAEQRGVAWLPTAVRVLILLFGVLAALDLLEITFAEDIVKIITAGLGIAFAVAFGVGGIDTAKQWWAKYLSPKS